MRRKQILGREDVARSVRRMAHEIIESADDLAEVVVVGIEGGGVPVAAAIAGELRAIGGAEVPLLRLDVTSFRDDRGGGLRGRWEPGCEVTDRVVVLVDDVLCTGRTVRAALDAVLAAGRARRVLLATLVDRGHRELPIRPDVVGRNLPTARDEFVEVGLDGVWIVQQGLEQ